MSMDDEPEITTEQMGEFFSMLPGVIVQQEQPILVRYAKTSRQMSLEYISAPLARVLLRDGIAQLVDERQRPLIDRYASTGTDCRHCDKPITWHQGRWVHADLDGTPITYGGVGCRAASFDYDAPDGAPLRDESLKEHWKAAPAS